MACTLFHPSLVWLSARTIIFLGCCQFHFALWFSRRLYYGFRRAVELILFLVMDVPSSLYELAAGDNAKTFARDINNILSNETIDWTLDDESTNPSTYMHVQRMPPRVFWVFPGTISYALHTFRRWWNGFYCLSPTDVYLESISNHPDLTFFNGNKAHFSPEQQPWRWRRMLFRYTVIKADKLMSDPFRLSSLPSVSPATSPLPDTVPSSNTLPSSSALATFVSQFNPAHAGL